MSKEEINIDSINTKKEESKGYGKIKYSLDPVKGFKDIQGSSAFHRELIIDLAREIARKYGAEPIQTPIVEKEWLFVKGVGDTTDIVTKEIFRLQNHKDQEEKDNFNEQHITNLVLRPEQTSSIMRFALKNRLDLQGTRRFLSYGPMFRHENPQKGRWRQFTQFSVEFFKDSYWADCDVLQCSSQIIQAISQYFSMKKDEFILKINFIGSFTEREKYCLYLQQEIEKSTHNFTEKAKTKALSNPLRVLDSKDPQDISALSNLRTIREFLDQKSIDEFQKILGLLLHLNIPHIVDPYLVRGLDYYNGLVFEWEINNPCVCKSTILGGGRYDYLSSKLSGNKINLPAVGFSLGVDRIIDYIEEYYSLSIEEKKKMIPICNIDASPSYCIKVMNLIRMEYAAMIIGIPNNISKNLTYIGKNMARYQSRAIILGSKEENENLVTIKYLFTDIEEHKQKTIPITQLLDDLKI